MESGKNMIARLVPKPASPHSVGAATPSNVEPTAGANWSPARTFKMSLRFDEPEGNGPYADGFFCGMVYSLTP